MSGDERQVETRWIKASEALELAVEKGEDPVAFKGAVAEFLRDGLLTARAEAIWTTTEANMHKAWRTHKEAADITRDLIVPVNYWRYDKRAAHDRSRWRWPYSKFMYTINIKPLKRRMIMGVELSLNDLERLRPSLFKPIKKNRSGRPPEVIARDAGWLEVVRISQDGMLHSGKFKTITSLKEEMKFRLQQEDGKLRLGINQIDEIAGMVLPTLKPRDPS